jgi:hypothetical protein
MGEAKVGATHAEQMRLNKEWEVNPTHSMTEAEYREQVLPRLAAAPVRVLVERMGVSKGYAIDVRAGEKVPHPRHCEELARLAPSLKGLTLAADPNRVS